MKKIGSGATNQYSIRNVVDMLALLSKKSEAKSSIEATYQTTSETAR